MGFRRRFNPGWNRGMKRYSKEGGRYGYVGGGGSSLGGDASLVLIIVLLPLLLFAFVIHPGFFVLAVLFLLASTLTKSGKRSGYLEKKNVRESPSGQLALDIERQKELKEKEAKREKEKEKFLLALTPSYRKNFIKWLKKYCAVSKQIPDEYQLAIHSGSPTDLPPKAYQAFRAWDKFQIPSLGSRVAIFFQTVPQSSKYPYSGPSGRDSLSARDRIYTGPRGGRYRVNSKGRKSYDVR